ncbi:S1C family serine protease [Paenibacillus thermotolerans]|uniref:S1C family serine protease n=1 Tax=Paenibacillus thermotolerans TaxID=3027807 RepID=UPI002367B629|nr:MULTISPECIES: trypsin-like peptidase domain-containing protein [unclassified Paenibacillus]
MSDQNKSNEYHYFSYGKLPSEPEQERKHEEEAAAEAEADIASPTKEFGGYPYTFQTSQSQLQAPPPQQPQAQARTSMPFIPEAPRKSSFKSVFASFLAGAVVVGSLMFASDHYNLFSGGDVLASGSAAGSAGTAETAASGGNGGSGISTAALDIQRPTSIADMVKKTSPAVVKIETFATQTQRSARSLSPFFDDPFFSQFFGDPGSGQDNNSGGGQPTTKRVQTGAGSGFFFDKEGYILTNEHVVDGAEEVQVVVEGEKEPYKAKVLGTAYDLDLAVLKIEGKHDFPTLPLGSSDNIQVGDWVVAIGNPYEFEHTVTVGVLSAKERQISIPDSQGTRKYQALLQTDASINPGNSGGPLLNLNGEVIGINTAVNAEAQGIGFAIPTSTINDVLKALKENKQIPRPFIGISMSDVPEKYLDDLGLKDSKGAFIQDVLFGSPAYKGGLQKYDVIRQLDGAEVKDSSQFSDLIAKKKPGEKISLVIVRNGKEMTVNVTVGDKNDQPQQ